VALQVHAADAGEVAQPWQVEPDDLAEVPGVGGEPVQAVVGRGGMG
jgi:hypothetical protein